MYRRSGCRVFVALLVVVLSTSCNSDKKLDAARSSGYQQGHEEGYEAGKQFVTDQAFGDGYVKGQKDGRTVAIQEARVAAYREVRENFARKVAIPIIAIALAIGILSSLVGWTSTTMLVKLYREIVAALETRKNAFRAAIGAKSPRRSGVDLAIPGVPFLLITLLAVAVSVYVARVELWIILAMLSTSLLAGLYTMRFGWLLLIRLVIFWIVTASFVLATWYGREAAWIREIAAISTILLPGYFLVRALFGTGWNKGWEEKWQPPALGDSEAWERGFTIAAVFGTTLQVTWLMMLYIVVFQPNLLARSIVGSAVTQAVSTVHTVEPTGWSAAGFATLALLVAAAIRFGRDPFQPKRMKELMPDSAGVALLLLLPTLILWFLINVWLFVTHYLLQIAKVAREFARDYLIRLLYLAVVLVLPFSLLLGGHALLRYAARVVSDYLNATASTESWTFLAMLGCCLLATSTYVLALTLLPLELRSARSIRQAIGDIHSAYTRLLNPILNIGGTSFMVLLSLLVIVIPVMTLFPGAVAFGPFAAVCIAIMMTTLIALTVWRRKVFTTEDRQATSD